MIKTLLMQKRILFKYITLIFFLLCLILFSITSLLQYNLNESQKKELINSEQRLVSVENTAISNKINKITSDLLYLTDSFRLNYDGNGDYTEVEREWLAFSDRKRIYDQIRFIDANGNELIRVNNSSNGAYLVDKADLQNKKDRYYFTDTINLNDNQVYVSQLDLNVENGEIEVPIKPTLRISIPYYQNGIPEGIVVLNYLADDMLHQVKTVSTTSNGDIYLLNSDGYWAYDSSNSNNEWSFMYEDRADISFRNNYPVEWETISNNEDGYLVSNHGVFIYCKIITSKAFSMENNDYSFILGAGDWTIVSFQPADSNSGSLFTRGIGTMLLELAKENCLLYLFALIISVVIAVLMSANKIERERIRYFSEFDSMTGVYNRRAGFEKLTQLYKHISTNSCQISICFLDINGLKEVNDALGHEAGDELIHSVISGIKNNIRKNDFVARLGGDEFLIIFEGLDEKKSEEIWERIVHEYALVNENENRRYFISVSHGIETFHCNANEQIDAIVNNADAKMYHEKKQIKKDLKVLNSY